MIERFRLWLARRAFDALMDSGEAVELEADLFRAPTSFREQTMTAGPTRALTWPDDF